jgi:glycine/D-amino acid oxidase-like deaminating enzyme
VGHYRNGILLAPITGELVAQEIMSGVTSPLMKAFTPERFQHAGVS